MKIRTGFVSNSSSSSFIIAIVNNGKNGEGEPFNHNIDLPLLDFQDIGNGKYKLYIDGFGGEVSCEIEEGDKFEYVNSAGPSGDELADYNVKLEDFNEKDILTYKSIKNKGGDVAFGAGYDG